MNIAENIKCKEFTFKCRPTGSRLRGMENTWEYEIWFRGKIVGTARTKKKPSNGRAIKSKRSTPFWRRLEKSMERRRREVSSLSPFFCIYSGGVDNDSRQYQVRH